MKPVAAEACGQLSAKWIKDMQGIRKQACCAYFLQFVWDMYLERPPRFNRREVYALENKSY
jgi:hypothetical protein